MKVSKFAQLEKNILIELIYDDGNLISENYSVIINSKIGVNCFSSTDNSTGTKNSITNQLVKLDSTQNQYGRFNLDRYSFIQKRDFGSSIPIRYDTLKIHFPVNYIFEGHIGFYIRISTLDYNNQKFVDLSNYYFNITDINQQNDMEYSSPSFIFQEIPWGKYIKLQFPSVTKVSDQRRLGVIKENSINYNLTDGVGLSKNAPILLDFNFINSMQFVNGVPFYILSSPISTSFPQTPEFEKFGVTIEKSTQGNFFLIYAIYNGSIGEFNQFIEESIINGNRYYLEYTINLYEKNIQTRSQKVIITEDFIEEIEYRPILKYSTTTAIIDVVCRLIDSVDESEIIRKSSYGILQDDVSNFSRYLTKINLIKSQKTNVYKIKGINAPNLDTNPYNNTSLRIVPDSFVVYSKFYNITLDKLDVDHENIKWIGQRKLSVILYPFDNVIKFSIISKDSVAGYTPLDINQYDDIKFIIRGDKKSFSFDVYQSSDHNDFDGGKVVFKISENKYQEIKKLYNIGFSSFYIIGIVDGVKNIIYTGAYYAWDIESNIKKLEDNFIKSQIMSIPAPLKNENLEEINKIEQVKEIISNEENLQTSVNTEVVATDIQMSVDKLPYTTSSISIDKKRDLGKFKTNVVSSKEADKKLQPELNKILSLWSPYWLGDFGVMMRSFNYQFESQDSGKIGQPDKKFHIPVDMRKFAIRIKDSGLIDSISIDINLGGKILSKNTQDKVDLILGYLKIYNFNPMDSNIIDYVAKSPDISNYLDSGFAKPYHQLVAGSNVPPTKDISDHLGEFLANDSILKKNKKG